MEVELKERVVDIARVAKVVKGGRNFRFSAVVVVGDENGHIGVGTGKAAEVPDAIKKAIDSAKKNIVEVPIVGTTVPHEYLGKFGAAKVLVKLAGYRDAKAKIIGTNNPRNVVNATIDALSKMKTIEEVAAMRNKSTDEIL